jgi:hypothetical protein
MYSLETVSSLSGLSPIHFVIATAATRLNRRNCENERLKTTDEWSKRQFNLHSGMKGETTGIETREKMRVMSISDPDKL